MSSTICRRCKRPLKDPVSVARGMGPTCAAKDAGQLSLMPEDPDVVMLPLCDPHVGDVVVRRDGATKYMNISQTLVYHSPTGLEWGYAGSGPGDFALNILYHFTHDKEFAMAHHQKFKFQFVAGLDSNEGIIKGDEIRKWIEEHRALDKQTEAQHYETV